MSDNLSLIVDENAYDSFRGADWPTYTDFIKNNFITTESLKTEIDNFIAQMQQNYDNIISPKTEELSIANQQRQKQIFFNKNLINNNHCSVPWNTLGVNQNGNVFICESPSWVPIFVGNMLETQDIFDILNSESAQKIRQEILSNRYFYCNNNLCTFFAQIDKETYTQHPIDTSALEYQYDKKYTIDQIPKNIIFDFDYTCNFKCPSCRMEVLNWNDDHYIRPINDRLVEKIKHQIIDRIVDQPVSIRWAGGEPFMSEPYLELLNYIIASGKRNIQNIIQTNGSLLQQKNKLVTQLLPYISELRISFDAASKETYKNIRVNGNWEKLLDNVVWVRDVIKKNGHSTQLTADFVVQKANYKEIPLFVKLCKELGITKFNLQKMWNWGTWDQETFDNNNIYNPTHKDYEDLLKQFKLAGQDIAKT
jgi:sulfatase maturation enzyme AslB (radical SAM superfamily)